jgi:hypothetical protein
MKIDYEGKRERGRGGIFLDTPWKEVKIGRV